MDIISQAARVSNVMARLSEKEGTLPQCVGGNLYVVKRRGYFWNIFLPGTSICVSFSCLDSATLKVYESDCAGRIRLHREEGRSANAF